VKQEALVEDNANYIVDQTKEEPSQLADNKDMIMTVKKETIKQKVIDLEYIDDANDSKHVHVKQEAMDEDNEKYINHGRPGYC
jgi:hypothetical protein